MLDIVEVALRRNKIKSFRGKGQGQDFTKAVDAFKAEAAAHAALLLPTKSGGQGLTLVEATQVYLAEPLLYQAERAQVVSRIHRVGQTRPTTVFSYVVKGTVEQAVVSSSSSSSSSSSKKKKLTAKELEKLILGN